VSIADDSAAAHIARVLKARGVKRVFALCGGHIMPIWMRLDHEGIAIVDVRDERAAVHMAQAHAELTGEVGVALATAGPGLTNAMTGIANAHVSRAPILVLSGVSPRPQENRGALQDLDHPALVRSITRYARTVREPALVPAELDEAWARALGEGGEPGPAFLDFPTDTLRAPIPAALRLDEHIAPKPRAETYPDPDAVARATDLLWSARRPLVVSGRGARNAGPELVRLLDRVGAAYLDSGESRGLVPDDHPSAVAAMRGRVMGDCDLVLTVGKRLDFQLAYGSPAIFGEAKFLRISDVASELRDNRRGEAEVLASPARTLAAMLEAAGNRDAAVDADWIAALEYPARKVLVASGDGAFGFNAMEIDTAVRHAAPLVIAVANNGAWQVEVHDQTVSHGKVVGTQLQFSDHAAMARAFGMHGERVEKAEDLPDAITRAFANAPALLDVVVTPEAVSSDAKTGLAWVPDLQPLAVWDDMERAWREG